MGEYKKAEEWLINAIELNSGHSSSHLMLAYVMTDLNRRVQSLLCLHYFLFLEPNSKRSGDAHKLLEQQFGGNVQKDENDPTQINIYLNEATSDTEFGPADLMISLLEASKSIVENKDKSKEELFIENTSSFFKTLGELKDKKKKGLWWDYYVPFFYDIAKSEHIDTYCYYISQSTNGNSEVWLENNEEKIESFSEWLREE